MRQLPPATTLKLAEIAWRYAHKGVVAFDLAGPEDGFSSEKHKVTIITTNKQNKNEWHYAACL